MRTPKRDRGVRPLPPNKHGQVLWEASWFFEGKLVRRRFPTKTEAVQMRELARSRIREGRYGLPRKEVRISFSTAADQFLMWSQANKRPGTAKVDRTLTERWKECFRDHALSSITAADIEAYKARQAAGKRTQKTVDNDLARMKRMFSLAVKWGLCPTNPVKAVDFFRPESRRDRFLSPEEEQALLQRAPAPLRAAIVFSVNTGLRQGEMLALRWQDVDLRQGQHGQVTIMAEVAKGKRTRYVPLNRAAREALDGLPRALNPEALVFGAFKGNARTLRHFWEPVVKASKLKGICWHSLRHSFASRLVMAGVDLTTVQKLLGHRTLSMVLKYAHLAPGHLEAGALALDGYYQKTDSVPQSGGRGGAQ